MNPLEELVEARLASQGSSIAELAGRLETEPSHLLEVLARPRQLKVDQAMKLAKELGVSVDQLGRAASEGFSDPKRS